MTTNTKSTKTEATEAKYYPAALATLLNKGLERVVEVSKTSMDLAVEQNDEALASYKKTLKAMPGHFLFDLAGQAFAGYVTLQKSLLDLAVEQTSSVIEASKEISHDPSETKAILTSMFHKSVDRTTAAQKSVQEFAAKQTKAVSDTVKQQPGVAGTPVETVTNSVQRGVDTVLANQKELLDVVTKTWKSTAAKA